MTERAHKLPPTSQTPDTRDDACGRSQRSANDNYSWLPTPIAHDISPAAGVLSALGYLCVAVVLFFAFATHGEGALLGAMVFVTFGVMLGLIRICIGLSPKPDQPINPDQRRRRGVHTGSGHLPSHHATLQIVIAPAALALAITLIAFVASCMR